MEDLEKRVAEYIRKTERALEIVEILPQKGTHMRAFAEELVDMARRYLDDAKHFKEKGMLVTALAAVSYAHAWLDIGVRLGVLRGRDSRLFMQ